MNILKDSFNRVHDYLRISLTDKCNLNCLYCNPNHNSFLKENKNELLTYNELLRLIFIFTSKLNFKKIRFTGGEPLLRKNVLDFFQEVSVLKNKFNFEIGLTTNATVLADKLYKLKEFGIEKINVSLDSLNSSKFKYITGQDKFQSVFDFINNAILLQFKPLKINAVIIKNVNDNEIFELIEFIKNKDVNIRFIEFMPFNKNMWSQNSFISSDEIKSLIETKYKLINIPSNKNKVAKDYRLEGFNGRVSFISAISNHFCDNCNRLRITSNGKMKLCLFSIDEDEINFKNLLRIEKLSDDEICEKIFSAIQKKELKHPEIDELSLMNKNNMVSIGG